MKKILFLLVFLLLPVCAEASQVGFVPADGIWFSRTDMNPGETIRVYTVVVNNQYNNLNGTVAFYDNDEVIDKVEVQALKKDEARQIRVFWEPTVGSHRLSAKFLKVEGVNESGLVSVLPPDSVNSVTGAPLFLESSKESGSTNVIVEERDGKLVLEEGKVLGVKVAAAETSTTSTISDKLTPENTINQAKNLVDQAKGIASSITSTAGKIDNVISSTKSAVETGKKWIDIVKEKWAIVKPYLDRIYGGWLVVTENNDPKRVVIAVVVILIIWFLFSRLFRSRY